MARPRRSLEQRFFARLVIGDGCWTLTRTLDQDACPRLLCCPARRDRGRPYCDDRVPRSTSATRRDCIGDASVVPIASAGLLVRHARDLPRRPRTRSTT